MAEARGRPKGYPKTGGNKKGSHRKETIMLTEMIDGALSELGGMKWLVQQGRENPVAFMTLIGKRLPRDVTLSGNPEAPLLLQPLPPKLTRDEWLIAHGITIDVESTNWKPDQRLSS